LPPKLSLQEINQAGCDEAHVLLVAEGNAAKVKSRCVRLALEEISAKNGPHKTGDIEGNRRPGAGGRV
jgi:hypothetical protein